MDSSPLDWGYHLPPCSTTFNQAPLWSLPISSRPSLTLSASIRSCRQARRARLRSALVNYYRLVKPQCLSCQRVQEKWTHFYVHALTYILGETVVKPAQWCCRGWQCFSITLTPNNGQGSSIFSVFVIFWCWGDSLTWYDPLAPNQPEQQRNHRLTPAAFPVVLQRWGSVFLQIFVCIFVLTG